ncbi:MAG: hypothetical protein JWN01_571 [Patescibacteria group bacterium]|nr:hypothetical protein [Patescibacteria group bacterium]
MFQTVYDLYITPLMPIIWPSLLVLGLFLAPFGFISSFVVKNRKAKTILRIAGAAGLGCLLVLGILFVINFNVPW